MATITVTSSINVDSLTWANGDTLNINDGGVVTVNTNQSKWWRTINVNNGRLEIINNSTGSGIRFLMGRNLVTSTQNIITLYGLGEFSVSGSLIDIGEGSGSANQTFTSWTTEYVPFMLVEKGPGSASAANPEDRFNIWMNVSFRSGSLIQGPYKDYTSSYAGDDRGLVFTQGMTDDLTYTTGSMMKDYFTSTLTVGNGVNGAVVPTGCKVFIPNIMLADDTESRYTTFAGGQSYIDSQFSGTVNILNCMFSNLFYMSLTQAKKVRLTNVGTSQKFNLTKCGDAILKNIGIGFAPISFNITAPGTRTINDNRWPRVALLTWNYLVGATIKNIRIIHPNTSYDYTASGTPFLIQYCQNLDVDGLTMEEIYPPYQNSGEVNFDFINDSTLKNLKFYSIGVLFSNCNNTTIDGYKVAHSMGKYSKYAPISTNTVPAQTYTNLPDGTPWKMNTPYYFKLRSWRDLNQQLFCELPRTSQITPFLPVSSSFPMRWTAYGSATNTITVAWVENNASNIDITAYRVYSGSSDPFTPNDATNRIYSGTGTSVTASVAENTRCYFILRKVYANSSYEDTPVFSAVTAFNYTLNNYLLQSAVLDNATWVKTNATVTANQLYPYAPVDPAATSNADRVVATGSNATVSQTVGSLTTGKPYTFSAFLADPYMLTASAQIKIQSGPSVASSASFILSGGWTLATASLTIPAGQNSVTCSLILLNSGSTMHVAGANLDSSSLARTYSSTTLAASTGGIIATASIGWDWVNKCMYSLYTGTVATFNTNHMLHVSTSSGDFAPTIDNCMVHHTVVPTGYKFTNLKNCTVKNIEHHDQDFGYAGAVTSTGLASFTLTNCSSTKFLNLKANNRFADTDRFASLSSCNNVILSNFNLDTSRRYVAGAAAAATGHPLLCDNTNQKIYVQNIRYSASLYEKGFHYFAGKNSYIRNVQGGLDIDRGTTAIIGGGTTATTGVGRSYVSVFDTNYFELQTGTGSGLLALRFNDTEQTSTDNIKFSGSFGADSQGNMTAWNYVGSASFKLPWKCNNITGFPAIEPKYYHTFTTDTTAAYRTVKPNCLSVYYRINNGAWKALTTSSLSSESITGEFDFEIKFEQNGFWLEFDTRSTAFVVGESVNGATSGATGVVEQVAFFSGSTTAGQIQLSSNTGLWADNESIRSGATVRALVNMGSGLVGGYPRGSAAISALDISVNYNSSSLYAEPYIGVDTTSGKAFIF